MRKVEGKERDQDAAAEEVDVDFGGQEAEVQEVDAERVCVVEEVHRDAPRPSRARRPSCRAGAGGRGGAGPYGPRGRAGRAGGPGGRSAWKTRICYALKTR